MEVLKLVSSSNSCSSIHVQAQKTCLVNSCRYYYSYFLFHHFYATLSHITDGKQQPDEYCNHHGQNSGEIFWDRGEEQKTSQRNGSREICNSNQKGTGSLYVKPSFPTKKRVQVPQCPPSETTMQHIQFEGELGETMGKLSKKSPTFVKEKPNLNEKGEPVLSPFFWLRGEENVESLSQHTDVDQLMDLPLPIAPSFSDIRDSDDENSDRVSQHVSIHFVYLG